MTVALVACAFDLWRGRIPNALTFGAAAAALVATAVSGGLNGVGWSAAGWLAGLVLFLPVYALGGMGAGDVKLLAALGAWLGPLTVFHAALYTGIAGGLFAVIVALRHGCLRQTFANIQLLMLHWRVAGVTGPSPVTLECSTSPKLPYALPMLVGTMVAIWLR
jgi:prepilin peptidase CpaA